jgi:D-cysteine desulfhydrase
MAAPEPNDHGTSDINAVHGRRLTLRRRVFLGVASAGTGGLILGRACGYEAPGGWSGEVLSVAEASVIAAAAEALVPDAPGAELPEGPSAWDVAHNVDEYLVGMPNALQRDVHALLVAVEQLTPLGGQLVRFTRLTPERRVEALEAVATNPVGRLIYRGLRDLVMLGFYQDQRTWEPLGYEGPIVGACSPGRWDAPPRMSRYSELISPARELPPGAR